MQLLIICTYNYENFVFILENIEKQRFKSFYSKKIY
jgi:hypothetical protein